MEPANNQGSRLITRRAVLGGALAAGGLLVVGCGNEPSGTPTGSPSGGPTPGPSATSTTVERVANLRLGVPSDILPDGMLRFTPGNQAIRRTVFDVLIDRAQDGSYVPSLASEWEYNADRTQLVIKLRDGVTYHSGRPFTADDVLFLIEAATAEGSGAQVAQLLKRGTMTKTGDLEVTVAFDAPFASYLDAFTALPVIDSETYDAIADGQEIVGTGPYTWESWTPGSRFEMARFDSYWGGEVPSDSLTGSVISEEQALLAAMRSGDLDMAERMVARDAVALEEAGFTVVRSPGFDYYVGANTAVAPLDDVRVRQAIAWALDRERIADQVFSGIAEVSSIPWASNAPGVTSAQVNHYGYDLDKARQLIQDAGAEGAEIAITPSPQEPTAVAVADIVQFALTEIGLSPRTASVEPAEFPTHIQGGTFEGLWVGVVGLTSLGPTTALMTANPLRADKNTHNHTPPEYQERHAAVIQAADEDALSSAVAEMTDYLLEQAFHATVVQASSTVVLREGLTGVTKDATLALNLTGARLTT